MPLALLTFFSGIAISTVAIYYSVLGLASIFSAAALPIIVMGTILELSKLVSAWWLKANWNRAPALLKSYMLIAVIVLMLITSMGIFGFLSKAHSDQAVPAGDAVAKLQIIDEKIAIQKEYIGQARKDIEVLNTQIDKYNELGAVSKGVKVRDQQKAEREQLLAQIETSQNTITKLREERAPAAASMRAIEAEVGPIKYIAAFVYGDNPDANILEKAVTWVIITIVFVFDPLAVLLLLASQMSFQWIREQQDREEQELDRWEDEWRGQDDLDIATSSTTGFMAQELKDVIPAAVFEEERKNELVQQEPEQGRKQEIETEATPSQSDSGQDLGRNKTEEQDIAEEANRRIAEIETEFLEPILPVSDNRTMLEKHPYLANGFGNGLRNLKPMVYNREEISTSTYKIFPDLQAELNKDEGLFVQNEEQKESNLWTKTKSHESSIDQLSRQELTLQEWINKINTGEIEMKDVPEHLILELRARR